MTEDLTPAPDGYVKKKRKVRRPDEKVGSLSINSLMDIVSIILVYLIATFASSPVEVNDPSVQLPKSTSEESIEYAPVVMITGAARLTIDPNNPSESKWVKNNPWILVDDKPVLALDPEAYRVADSEKDPRTGNYVINKLRDALVAVRELQDASADVAEVDGFTGKVIILADKETPYRVLTDVLVTCGEAGFGEFRFAIIRKQ